MRNGPNNNNNNKRMRNRNNNHNHSHNNNNNNRRNQNPMTRVFESNGPDIKIRGTASHIAEKYVQLARDARTSGDPVAAENYYQHAEHYFRLIAAAQEQFRQSQPAPRDGFAPEGGAPEDSSDEDGADFQHFGAEPGFAPAQQQQPPQQQPYQPREQRDYQPRHDRQPRQDYARQEQPRHDEQPREQRDSYARDTRPAQPVNQPQPEVSETQADQLPAFITGGAQSQPTNGDAFGGTGPAVQGESRFPPRRRRRPHAPRPDAVGGQPSPAGEDVGS